jgi:predicted transposase YbfD/YdcC
MADIGLVWLLFGQEGLEAFIDIPSSPDIIDFKKAIAIIDLVKNAITLDAVGAETREIEAKLMSDERIIEQIPDRLANQTLYLRM